MNLRTASPADQDVVDAAVWFERQQPGLGDDFLNEVEAAFEQIQGAPLTCPTPQLEASRSSWNCVGRT